MRPVWVVEFNHSHSMPLGEVSVAPLFACVSPGCCVPDGFCSHFPADDKSKRASFEHKELVDQAEGQGVPLEDYVLGLMFNDWKTLNSGCVDTSPFNKVNPPNGWNPSNSVWVLLRPPTAPRIPFDVPFRYLTPFLVGKGKAKGTTLRHVGGLDEPPHRKKDKTTKAAKRALGPYQKMATRKKKASGALWYQNVMTYQKEC